MMRMILVGVLVCAAPAAYGTLWPVLGDPKITSCKDSGGNGPCNTSVAYSTSGTRMVDIVPVGVPHDHTRQVMPVGVHCGSGNAMTGNLPFKSCVWRNDIAHRPTRLGKCALVDVSRWELTSDSDCSVSTAWAGHGGAGPGGECVLFTNATPSGTGAINTPWGLVTPEQAANSGNRFCSKPLAPNVHCELKLPSIIDHGTIRAGESSKREDDGAINCGVAPKIDVLVSGDRESGGVRITAAPIIVNATTVRIVSEIKVSDSAVPGEHAATYVFVASPY